MKEFDKPIERAPIKSIEVFSKVSWTVRMLDEEGRVAHEQSLSMPVERFDAKTIEKLEILSLAAMEDIEESRQRKIAAERERKERAKKIEEALKKSDEEE